MPWFQCLIHGENFSGSILGKQGLIGFYTTRVVEAGSVEDAEWKALAELREDERLQVPESEQTMQARVFFDKIVELDGRPAKMPAGFTFYSLDP